MKSTNKANLILAQQEVENFVQHIETWFNGTATDKTALYQCISTAFDPAFTMQTGDGNTIDYATFLPWLTAVYGQFPTRKVQLEDLAGYATQHHAVIQFIEIQQTDEMITKRKSSAVFILQDNKALWYHLVEQWID